MYRNITEAQNAKLELVERIQAIEVQLMERAAEVSVGRVPDEQYKQYVEWRVRACRAKAGLITKLVRTKAEINRMRQEAAKSRADSRGGADGLLSDLYGLTKSLVAAGADITNEEQVLLDDISAYLQNI